MSLRRPNSERVEFKLLDYSDIESLITMYHEKDSNKYIRPLRNKTDQEYREFLEMKIRRNREGEHYFWALYTKDNQFLGSANLNYFTPFKLEHVGVHLSRNFWSQGYASGIINAILEFARTLGRAEIYALVEEGHLASIRLMEKCGLQQIGQRESNGDLLRIYKKEL